MAADTAEGAASATRTAGAARSLQREHPGVTTAAPSTARASDTDHRGPNSAVAAVAHQQSAGAPITACAGVDPCDARPAGPAVAEPAGGPAVSTVESVAAVADKSAVTAVAGSTRASPLIAGVAIAVAVEDPRVGVVGSAVADEEPNQLGNRIDSRCRRGRCDNGSRIGNGIRIDGLSGGLRGCRGDGRKCARRVTAGGRQRRPGQRGRDGRLGIGAAAHPVQRASAGV